MNGFKKIDRYLGVMDRKVVLLSRLNPTNANLEKRKFLYEYVDGRVYNPVFRYKTIKINLKKAADDLGSLNINIPRKKDERWFFASNLEKKRKRILKKIQCLQHRGTGDFSKYSAKIFGNPGATQIEYAKRQFTPEARSAFISILDSISDAEAAKMLQRHITNCSISWQVKFRKNMSSKAGLDSRSRYLLIKSGERFAPEEISSLAVHEIETHIFRKENGTLQSLPFLFGEGFAGPPTTEEGLAFFNETQGHHDPRRMLIISARTIAAHLADKKSFYDVFHRLHALGLPLSYAWNITLRVKRGCGDTSSPGAFTKDHHYLKGYMDVKKFLERGGNIESLYAGKLNITSVESLMELGIETRGPKYLPNYLNSEKIVNNYEKGFLHHTKRRRNYRLG